MKITVNNKTVDLADCATVDMGAFLAGQGVPEKGVATALNGRVVRRDLWSGTILKDGDTITVIRAVCGG